MLVEMAEQLEQQVRQEQQVLLAILGTREITVLVVEAVMLVLLELRVA